MTVTRCPEPRCGAMVLDQVIAEHLKRKHHWQGLKVAFWFAKQTRVKSGTDAAMPKEAE